MNFKKIYFLCPIGLYDIIAIKTNGFKDIDNIICELLIKHLLSEEERHEIRD